MSKTIILLVAAVLCGATATAQKAERPITWQTDTVFVHDPVMALEDGTYHLFATGNHIAHMTSRDRKTWTVYRDGLIKDIPAWTHDSVPGFEKHIWAPDIIHFQGKWWLAYSCSTFGRNTSAIGLLSNTSLSNDKGWRDEGCVVSSKENRDNWNAIDPAFIVDEKGQPWMTFGSFWDGIQLVKLDNTMHIAKGEKPFTIARRYPVGHKPAEENPTSKYAGPNAIEAPFILKRGDWYYLFVSQDYCCRGMESTYRVAVGRSRQVAGPYLDREGKDMAQGGGTVLLEGDKKEYEATGHSAAYDFPDGYLFICHGYSVAQKGASVLVQRGISWDEQGWPVLAD